ncbi:MSHA biogenesis protein MshD [Thalassotalea insulae]|uniref:MSHA biogenesis protein MshD n=1 Tax=Thalassotalea insulae TaxID=2056778 RepID=A0ABQ6GPL0_9GAMM|nr:type II secretion system protein [Thalassotalea insulae]GLX77862.1 MSHA biogenesis protein MshD [Thalassotalea insulae]
MRVNAKGFTLVETIVGIVVLAISFSILTTLIYPLVGQSADQLHQIRAAELGQSILNEIQNKAFDEHSDMAGGVNRCGEDYDGNPGFSEEEKCTLNTALGHEEGKRDDFDDVDDYHNTDLTYFSEDMQKKYSGYSVTISVCNDGNYDGECSEPSSVDISTAKLIKVTITTPTGFDIVFSTYRANF